MAPFEVMISESQERMLAIVLPERLPEVLAVCRRWNLPAAVIGRVTSDGDIAVLAGGVDGAGLPRTSSRELARIPARALTSDAIVHSRLSAPPAHRRAAPAPGAPELPHDGLPERGMDPGAGAAGAARRPEPGQPRLGHHALRRDRGRGHGRGQRARRGRAAHQGHAQGAGDGHRRLRARRRPRPVAGCRARGRRVHAERGDHRCPAAGRHELPQLRQPGAPRGVLAARRRPFAASATRAARWACRSPAATSACTTNRRPARSHRPPRSASSASSRTWSGVSGRPSGPPATWWD